MLVKLLTRPILPTVSKKFMVVTTNRNISMYDMKGNPVAPSIQQGGPEGTYVVEIVCMSMCARWTIYIHNTPTQLPHTPPHQVSSS